MKRTLLFATIVTGFAAHVSAQSAPTSSAGQEYVHNISKSLFAVGDNPRSRGTETYQVTEGLRGSFLVETNTHATLAVLSGAAEMPAPLSADEAVNLAEARAYLVGAGIPEKEIGGMHVTTTMMHGGPDSAPLDPATAKLLYFTCHLERVIDEIAIQGSFAFVAFDATHRVITEGVYWPSIPARVLQSAKALTGTLANAASKGQYVSMLRMAKPDAAELPGEIKVVHTSAWNQGVFEAKAVYGIAHRSAENRMYVQDLFDEHGHVTQVEDRKVAIPESPK
jgi:hypothetical protein